MTTFSALRVDFLQNSCSDIELRSVVYLIFIYSYPPLLLTISGKHLKKKNYCQFILHLIICTML